MNDKVRRRIIRWIGLALLFVLLAPAVLAETATEIAMHPYVDETDGTTFMLPDGWSEDMSPQSGFSSVTTYIQRPDSSRKVIFMHLSVDDWQNGQRFASNRVEYDNLMNSAGIISTNFGGVDIEEVDFNGITYFRYMSQESTWQYFRFHNGYLHMFQFDVDTDDPYYAYFEAIMNTVVFPEIQ